MPILVVGSIVLDYISSPYGKSEGALGGSAIYFAGAASPYCEVRLVGVVGDDFPDEGHAFLEERRVNVEGLTTLPGKTFHYAAEYGKDIQDRKTISTCLNVFEQFHPALPESYLDTPIVFLGNIAPSLQIEVLDQIGSPFHVAADTMNFWIDGTPDDLRKMLRRIDTLFINDSEVRELTGELNLITAIRAVTRFGPATVVVKKGEHGAILYHEGEFCSIPAFPLERVVDPTGAGDAFAGGMLGYLAARNSFTGVDFRRALLHGTAVASFVVEEFGPRKLSGLDRKAIKERIDSLENMIRID